MIKTRMIKVKSIKNEEVIMVIAVKKKIAAVIMTMIIVIRMIMRIRIGNCTKI